MRARSRRLPDGKLGPAALNRAPVASLKFLLLAVLVGYAAITLLVWLAQERLLFFPQPVHGKAVAPQGWHIEEVRLQSRDGTPLAGVLVRPPVERPPLVIYFGGNAEEVTAFAPEVAQAYGDRAVLLVNYRGYGDSGGKPGERGMVSDALEVFDWAAKNVPKAPKR